MADKAFTMTKAVSERLVACENAYCTARDTLEETARAIADEWQEVFEDRSESWQQSEAGVAAQERIQALSGLADELHDFFVDLPDFVIDDIEG
jgi:hypothetical protein